MTTKFLTRAELEKLIDEQHESVRFVQFPNNQELKMKTVPVLLKILKYILINTLIYSWTRFSEFMTER